MCAPVCVCGGGGGGGRRELNLSDESTSKGVN